MEARKSFCSMLGSTLLITEAMTTYASTGPVTCLFPFVAEFQALSCQSLLRSESTERAYEHQLQGAQNKRKGESMGVSWETCLPSSQGDSRQCIATTGAKVTLYLLVPLGNSKHKII